MKLKVIFCCVFLFASLQSIGQDSLKTLSLRQVMEIVRQHHPVAKQADLVIEKAKADVTVARGLFDPQLENETAQKTFDGIDYYYYNRPGLKIPTWFGAEVSAGLEYLSGSRTDPVETKGETSYVGISLPLGKNLVMDKRRAALQTAKIFRTASAVEKRNMLNNLLLDAVKAYWNWSLQYEVYKILTEAVSVNEKRVQWVKAAHRLGDRPAIDTVEAATQLQNLEMQRSGAWLDFQNAALDLSVYLWTAGNLPYQLPVDVIPSDGLERLQPESVSLPALAELLAAAREQHPELLLYNFKLDVLRIERKLKFQDLLPDLTFRYNQLGKGYNVLKTANGPLFEENFRYGLSLAVPLRLSQGRGAFKKAKLNIMEAQLEQSQKMQQVENKVKTYYNTLTTVKSQVELQEKTYYNYLALQRGEETRFRSGESSLFLVNARENKTLEALQKWRELKAKYITTEATLQWAAGLLVP